MKVYFISGLGADRRIFRHIRLPTGFQAEYIDWIAPGRDEPLAGYALRLTAQIDTSAPFILVGMSLGGIMAVEIAKRFPPVTTVIIGSVPLSAQLPRYYKAALVLRITKILPGSFFLHASAMKRWFTRETAGDKRLILQMIREGDARFVKWALNAVLDWKNETLPPGLCHIHGSRDEVFPARLTRPHHIIPKGGHLLVMTHPAAINDILSAVFQEGSDYLKVNNCV